MHAKEPRSLQDVIDAGENIVDVLRNAQEPRLHRARRHGGVPPAGAASSARGARPLC